MTQMPSIIRAPHAVGRVLRRCLFLAPVCAAMLAGCVDDVVAPHVPARPADATPLYWSLRNDHRAVTLSIAAPHDTLRIRAVPLDGAGKPLILDGAATYTSSQPARVQVSADGLIRAIAPGTNVYVISSLASGNTRHVDTTIVTVTSLASPPAVGEFSVQPVPPDSARWTVFHNLLTLTPGYTKRLPLHVRDAAGNPIPGVAVRYTSSDPEQVPIGSFTGEIKAKGHGRATFAAEATIYGAKWVDSVEFAFDWPVATWMLVGNAAPPGAEPRLFADPSSVRIARGGTVTFMSLIEIPVGIEFDDPTNVEERTTLRCPVFPDMGGRGNIATFGGGPANFLLNCRSRRFPVPGEYTFRITPSGGTGRIVVEDRAP